MFPRFCPWRRHAEQDITHALTNFPHSVRAHQRPSPQAGKMKEDIMEEDTIERNFQEERLESKRKLVLNLEKRDAELSNDIAKVQGISLEKDECEIGE